MFSASARVIERGPNRLWTRIEITLENSAERDDFDQARDELRRGEFQLHVPTSSDSGTSTLLSTVSSLALGAGLLGLFCWRRKQKSAQKKTFVSQNEPSRSFTG